MVSLARMHFIPRMFHYAATFRYRINTMLSRYFKALPLRYYVSPFSHLGVITPRGNCARMTVANKGDDPAATIRSSALSPRIATDGDARNDTIPAVPSPDRQLVLISRIPRGCVPLPFPHLPFLPPPPVLTRDTYVAFHFRRRG